MYLSWLFSGSEGVSVLLGIIMSDSEEKKLCTYIRNADFHQELMKPHDFTHRLWSQQNFGVITKMPFILP